MNALHLQKRLTILILCVCRLVLIFIMYVILAVNGPQISNAEISVKNSVSHSSMVNAHTSHSFGFLSHVAVEKYPQGSHPCDALTYN